MDIIILGILMLKHSTIYEIREVIRNYLSSISSNSTGSIQAGIKKMLAEEMITYKDVVEKGITKKVYSITEKGKGYFMDKVATPMLYKEKNMELNKLFFLGFIDKRLQIKSLSNYISELEKELGGLKKIETSLSPRYPLDQKYMDDVKQHSGAPELMTISRGNDIAKFQYAVLDFGIDKLEFEIAWLTKFTEQLYKEGKHDDT